MRYLVLLIFCIGCSSDDSYTIQSRTEGDLEVHPRLLQYYQMFADAAKVPVPVIKMTIGNLESTVAGKCYKPGGKPVNDQVGELIFGEGNEQERRIVINRSYYEKHEHNESAIQQVVFHELGHCLLDREHDEDWVELEGLRVPKSIMFSRSFGDQPWYPELRPYYSREMFGRSTGLELTADSYPDFNVVGDWTCGNADHDHGDATASN